MSGRLFGVGVGPGDPELMTLKAHRLIASAKVLAYPVLENGDSFARAIAADSFKGARHEIKVTIPITTRREPAQAAYDAGAEKIAAVLETGQDVVMLCEGDPLFYGSFMYILARLEGRFPVEVVPGVTSVSASAASLARPLVARNDQLAIIPGPLGADRMRARINESDAVAIMKVGRHLPKIRAVLADLGLVDRAVYIERASLGTERRMPLAEAPENAPYFSMILMTRGGDPWL